MADEWTDRLSDFLDDELSAADRGAVELHLRECAACASTLEDLRRLVEDARTLSPRAPADDLWPAIAARVQTTRQHRAWWRVAEGFTSGHRLSFSLPQLAAAALALLVLGGGLTWTIRRPVSEGTTAVSTPARPAPDTTTSASTVTLANFADPQFDAAVADLQRALEQGRGRLDPQTIAILEKNLTIIDGAIAQARQALASDPANTYLNGHLADARRRKLELLRQATSLPDLSS